MRVYGNVDEKKKPQKTVQNELVQELQEGRNFIKEN